MLAPIVREIEIEMEMEVHEQMPSFGQQAEQVENKDKEPKAAK